MRRAHACANALPAADAFNWQATASERLEGTLGDAATPDAVPYPALDAAVPTPGCQLYPLPFPNAVMPSGAPVPVLLMPSVVWYPPSATGFGPPVAQILAQLTADRTLLAAMSLFEMGAAS